MKKQPNSGIPPKLRPAPEDDIFDHLEREYSGVTEAFDKLRRKGIDAAELRGWLYRTYCQLVWNPDKEWKKIPKVVLDAWKKKRAERYRYGRSSPKRLRQMAVKVERIFKALGHIYAFDHVPKLLRDYATTIEDSARGRTRWERDPEHGHEKRLQVFFVDFVHTETGHYYYEDVATLLTAVFGLAGEDRIVDAETLKMLYRRYPTIRLRISDVLAQQLKRAKHKVNRKK